MAKLNVTAVIMTYMRPQNLQRQIEAIRNQTHPPEEIIIGHLYGPKSGEFDFDGCRTVTFQHDPGPRSQMVTGLCHARESDFIALFDDDIIPGRKWFEHAIECYKKHPGIYGGSVGMYVDEDERRLYRPLWGDDKEWGQQDSANQEFAHVDVIGQSWFLTPEDLALLWSEPLPFPVDSGGDDIWLGYRADQNGVKCILPPFPEDDQQKWGVIDRPEATADHAIHNRVDNHEEDRMELIRYGLENGWEPIGNEYHKKPLAVQ